jgi:hypothetical protein
MTTGGQSLILLCTLEARKQSSDCRVPGPASRDRHTLGVDCKIRFYDLNLLLEGPKRCPGQHEAIGRHVGCFVRPQVPSSRWGLDEKVKFVSIVNCGSVEKALHAHIEMPPSIHVTLVHRVTGRYAGFSRFRAILRYDVESSWPQDCPRICM